MSKEIYLLEWDFDLLYFSSYENALIGAANIIVDQYEDFNEYLATKYMLSDLVVFLKSREYRKALDLWNNICCSDDYIHIHEISQENIISNPTHPTADKLKELEEIVSSGLEK